MTEIPAEPPTAPPPGSPPGPAPALGATPGWVPAAVVAGAVLLVEGVIVGRIQPGDGEGAARVVSDLAGVSMGLGLLSLVSGYLAFLLSRTGVAEAITGLVLSAVGVLAYALSWTVLLKSLAGQAADLFSKETLGLSFLELEGKGAAVAAILVLVAGLAACAFCIRTVARIAWPHFRSGVALNVLAMVHIVVVLLGVVSWINFRYVPGTVGSVDLTETKEFSLSSRTTAVLGRVEGELTVLLVDYGASARTGSGLIARVRDLLREYQASCPRMKYRQMDALRSGEEMRATFMEEGLGDVMATLTGEEDCIVLAYRPPGEKLNARTKVVPVGQDMTETSALGAARFRGEGVLTNAVNEVVFVRRKVLFLEGHGERSIANRASPAKSLGVLADALRSDNFAVAALNLSKEPGVPVDADLVVVAGPEIALPPAEAEALRTYLQAGGSMLLLLEPEPRAGARATGLEDLLASFGVEARRDVVIVPYLVENTQLAGPLVKPTTDVAVGREEFGRHASMEALRGSGLVTAFFVASPIFRLEKLPEGVVVDELAYAPREAGGYKTFGALLRDGRQDIKPQTGDIVDKRLPVGVVAERKVGASARGGGRLIVIGDADFAVDLRLEPDSPGAVPANRTLLLNAASWAVRRDVIAIDPKTLETETVQLRPLDRELAFWVTVVALPVIALGVAVGVWWTRRR